MTTERDTDARIRRAWAHLDEADARLPSLPDDAFAAVEAAVGTSAPAPARTVPPRRGPWRVLGLCAAVLAVGLVAGTLIGRVGGSAEGSVTAAAGLERLDAPVGTTGEVTLVDDAGRLHLDVSLRGVAANEGRDVLEVWLLDPDTGGLLALGAVDGDARLPVPSGVDLDAYSVVDVSREPLDGDPTHSAESLLRGTLEPA